MQYTGVNVLVYVKMLNNLAYIYSENNDILRSRVLMLTNKIYWENGMININIIRLNRGRN